MHWHWMLLICLVGAGIAIDPYRKADEAIASQGLYWDLIAKQPKIIVSKTSPLPSGIDILSSNNCLSITMFDGKLFVGWRSAPTHFASKQTKIFIMSSKNNGTTWTKQNEVFLGSDMREPFFLQVKGRLFFYFFQAGTNPAAFQPNSLFRIQYFGQANWSKQESWGQPGQIAWQYQVQNDTAYVMSYLGDHYGLKFPKIKVYFNKSSDGIHWEPVNASQPVIYVGGISEVGWMFDLAGRVYGVGRNEDGDASGWGRRVLTNANGSFACFGNTSDPNIIESPRMFRHGDDLYLVGRTDPTGTFQNTNFWENLLPRSLHHYLDLGLYSLRPHGNAIWKVLKGSGKLWKVVDLPGCGDTSFPSVLRISEHKYWLANYSSPMELCEAWPWLLGQISAQGTQIHIVELEFI